MLGYVYFITIISVLLLLDRYYSKRIGLFTYVAIFITILFIAFRDNIGYDYLQYKWMFSSRIEGWARDKLEPGFLFVTDTLYLLGCHYLWGFFIFGSATILLLCHGIKLYTQSFRLAFYIYLLIPGIFLNSFSTIRQSFAIILLFNGIYYYLNGKKNVFWEWAVVAFLFHYSVIFTLPFILLLKRLRNHVFSIAVIGMPLSIILAKINVVGIIISTFFMNTPYGAYGEFEDAGTSFAKLLVLNSSLVLYLCFYKRISYVNQSLLLLLIFGVMFTNVFNQVGALTRMSYYFRIFEIIIVPNVILAIKSPKIRLLMYVSFIIYFLAVFFNSLYFDSILDIYPKLTPYKTVLY